MSEQGSTQSYSEEGVILPRIQLASVAVLVEHGLTIPGPLVCVAVKMGLLPVDACPGCTLVAALKAAFDSASYSSLKRSYGDAFSVDGAGDEISGESDDEDTRDVENHRSNRRRLSTEDVSPANSAGYPSDNESGSDSDNGDEEADVGLVDYTLRTPVNWAALEEGSDDEYDQLVDEDDDEESYASLAETEDNEDDTEDASEPIAALYADLRELPVNRFGTTQLVDEDEDEETAAYLPETEDKEDDTEDASEPIAALYVVLRELPVNRFGTTQLVDEDNDEESAAYLLEPEDNEEDTEDASEPTGIAALYAVLRELPLNRWGTIY
ncbi:hypothetical protein D9611_014348 [Ephemerocybe angulata]|uniref:Uncharacterized protein n=1 Tax=Ephemerocybe angulata TaxID=980116 RepID=A0A8H5EZV0_9AGAR|nr:hypothetical protein D9611_014348 [Tulosesus angulatus]